MSGRYGAARRWPSAGEGASGLDVADLLQRPSATHWEPEGSGRTPRAKRGSDQGRALPDRVVTDVVDLAGDETSGHARGQSHADEVPPDRVFHDRDGPAWVARVERRDIGQ